MRSSFLIAGACLLVVVAAPRAQQPSAAPNDAGAVLVSRLDLERYKATIKGLTQFGDRRQGTDRNRAAVDWIESQLKSYGCPTARIRYEYKTPPPSQNRGRGRGADEAQGGGRLRGIRTRTGVNTDPMKQPDERLRALDTPPAVDGPREEVYCTKWGTSHRGEMYIVSAHMDGHGWGEAANDDGSGTALVMELARVFSGPDVQTDRTIRFALWNNEETGLNGARAYVEQRESRQGTEDEPRWLGMIQHDMMLFDHGMPNPDGTMRKEQRAEADVNIEFQSSSKMAADSQKLAWAFERANEQYATDYPAAVGPHMTNTDSGAFQDVVASISLRENERGTQIGAGWDPQWHQPTDVYATYNDKDFRLGLNAAQTTLGAVAQLAGATVTGQKSESPLVERVGDTGFIQLRADSFSQLTPPQQALAYWLTQAAIAIDPIIYDQLSQYGIREKRLLEGIMGHSAGIAPEPLAKIRSFALLFWANRGNHNENTAQKFLPAFTFDELQAAALKAQANGAFKTGYADLPPLADAAALGRELGDLRAPLFDPTVEPTATAKAPPPGKDIIQASANTFYRGVTLADLKNFKERYPLNSRIVRTADGALREEVYRAGTPDGRVAPGLYAVYLRKAVEYLGKARVVAAQVDMAEAKAISDLIRYYETGEPAEWLQFGSDWVRDDAAVDFANGFIEVYRDARGAKGSSQAFVTVTDRPVTTAMTKLAQNAPYFEQKAPWDAKYKRQEFTPPVVKAVEVLVETGDFHVTTIGDNLPNENEIHEQYGTKNFLFLGSSHALDAAAASKSIDEFAASPEEAQRANKFGEAAEDLLTAMHEVIGHGSGKLNERLAKGGAAPYLKEYFSTLEEARADLMALWNVWDPKLKELGLVQDQEDVAKAMYDSAARVALTQLRRIPRGDTIEEDHQRNRQLIVNFIKDKTGAIEQFDRGGKTYIRVTDYQKMRQGVGLLLAELMRIKGEGDYGAIKALIDQYAVHFDPKLRDQVVARYKQLDLPTYWAGVNAELTAELDAKGNATAVRIAYPRDPLRQYLAYGRMYDRQR